MKRTAATAVSAGNACEVLFIDDLVEILGTSRRTIERLLRHRSFPIPEVPHVGKKHRWSRAAVDVFLATPEFDGYVGRRRRRVDSSAAPAPRRSSWTKPAVMTEDDALDALLAKPNPRRPRSSGRSRS